MMTRFAIFLIFIFGAFVLQGQSLNFKHITTAGGLLSDVNLKMAEDKLGRLWIAGTEGVNVFDGYEVVSYSLPGNSGLLSNNVLQIFNDEAGTIWIATDLGIQSVSNKDGRFVQEFTTTGQPIKNGRFFFEHGGTLYVANHQHCFKRIGNTWQMDEPLSKIIQSEGTIYAMHKVNNDKWLCAFYHQVMLVQIPSGKVHRKFPFTRIQSICSAGNDSSFVLGSFVRDSTLLLNAFSGTVQNIIGWKNEQGEVLGGYMAEILPAGNGQIAMAGRFTGLTLLDVSRRSFIRYLHQPGDPQSINASFTRRLFITRNGTVFVSCNGLSYTSLKPLQFLSVSAFTAANGRRVDGVINGFGEDHQGQIWVATNSHLVQWNRFTGISRFYEFLDKAAGDGSTREIRAIAEDNQKRIWVGSFVGGLGVLENGKIRQVSVSAIRKPGQLPGNNITAIIPLQSGKWMIGTMEGFALFDPIHENFTTFNSHPALATIAGNATYHVYEDGEQNWWFAQAAKGIWKYDAATQRIDRIKDLIMPENTDYYNIADDKQGHLFVTSTTGLAMVDMKKLAVVKRFTKYDGLATDLQYGVITDGEDNIWTAGNRGLARYTHHDKSIRSFDAYDGVLQSNHKVNSFFRSRSGELFFGGEDGFNHFYPLAIRDESTPFTVQVSSADFSDLQWESGNKELLILSHFRSNASFHFLTTDFMLAPYMQYRYQLTGFDSGWVMAGRQRQARYTNLNAGRYEFLVQASVDGKKWIAADQPIAFQIKKAWWHTWWFRGLILLLTSVAIYVAFYMRVKKIRQQNALKVAFDQKMARVQMNLLRAQMNPHFIYNSLNSIHNFILKNDRQNASGYLTKFSRLMRLILDNSRNEWVTLESELKAIELYIQLESLRFNNSFDFELEVQKHLKVDSIVLPPMLLQPYIENAIWHGLMYRTGGGGLLQIHIYTNEDKLMVRITDNGVGRIASQSFKSKSANPQKSYGMKITDERLQMVNDIYNIQASATVTDKVNENGEVAGTNVLLALNNIQAPQ